MNTSYFMQELTSSLHNHVQVVHYGAVNDLDIDTTEHKFLLSGGSDGSLAVHDLQDLREDEHNYELSSRNYRQVCSISGKNKNAHKGSIETVQWFPLDTGKLTSSGADMVLKIWDANLLEKPVNYPFNGIVHCHHMSPIATRHNFIAVGTDSSEVELVDSRFRSTTHYLLCGHEEGAVRAVQWSNRDEFILATGGDDNFALLWDVRMTNLYLTKFQRNIGIANMPDTTHDGSVNGVAFTADGLHLATIGADQKFLLWDTLTGQEYPAQFPPLSNIEERSVKFCLTKGESENFAFIPTGASITSFNVLSPGKARHLYGHYDDDDVNCCVYYEQGSQLISGGKDHRVVVWTPCGNRGYAAYLREKMEAMIDKRSRARVLHAMRYRFLIPWPEDDDQTLDTCSDYDDDGDGDDDDYDGDGDGDDDDKIDDDYNINNYNHDDDDDEGM